MDFSFLIDVFKILILLPLVLALVYISLKYGNKYFNKLQSSKVIKVYERVPIGQNVFLSIVTIAGKPYLITNGEKGAQILLELDENVLQQYQINQELENLALNNSIVSFIEKIKGKVKNEKV